MHSEVERIPNVPILCEVLNDAEYDHGNPNEQPRSHKRQVPAATPPGMKCAELEERHPKQHQARGFPDMEREEHRGLGFECGGYPVRHLIDPGAAIRCQLFFDELRTRLPLLNEFGFGMGRPVWNPEQSESDCDQRSNGGENERG